MTTAKEVKITGRGVELLETLRNHLVESRGYRVSYSQAITEACHRMMWDLGIYDNNGAGQTEPESEPTPAAESGERPRRQRKPREPGQSPF